jgi:ribosome-associated toxin RatA of RatAB toxin-antitoxin module
LGRHNLEQLGATRDVSVRALYTFCSHGFDMKTATLTAIGYALLTLLGIVFPCQARVAEMNGEWAHLLAGEVITTPVHNAEGLPGVQARFIVAASRQRIWSVLVDYQHFTQIFPTLSKLRVLRQDAQGARVEYWADVPFFTLHYVLDRHYLVPGRLLTWSRVSGSLKRIEGAWEIRDTPRPGTHLLVYESYVKASALIPASLVRRQVLRKTYKMGERLRDWIEGRIVPMNGSQASIHAHEGLHPNFE